MADMKAPDAFRTISEVSTHLDVPQHVLRFWEGKFTQVKPLKRGGGRRYYRPEDIALLSGIRALLYGEGYTIRGVQKVLREQGVKFVAELGTGRVEMAPATAVSEAVSDAVQSSAAAPGEGRADLVVVPRVMLTSLLEDLIKIKELLGESDGKS